MDQTGICNYALVKLGSGADLISDITEDSRNARALNVVWQNVVDEVLRSEVDWPFAIETQALSLLAAAPVRTDYSYQFAMPVDPPYIRMVNIPDYPEIPYEIEGTSFLVNVSEVTVRYIKRVTNTALFPPDFINAVACRLAAETALTITDSRAVKLDMLAEYASALVIAQGNAMTEKSPIKVEKLWTERG